MRWNESWENGAAKSESRNLDRWRAVEEDDAVEENKGVAVKAIELKKSFRAFLVAGESSGTGNLIWFV